VGFRVRARVRVRGSHHWSPLMALFCCARCRTCRGRVRVRGRGRGRR